MIDYTLVGSWPAGEPIVFDTPYSRPTMIRTGYLRWEIEAEDVRCAEDRASREVILRARPTFRRL
ncbi:MAG: hypothetical protein ACKO0V_03810, partial [bacterium]